MSSIDSSFACNICNAGEFKIMSVRADKRNVIQCANCGMGVLENIPNDLSVFYQDGYYEDASTKPESGYVDYDEMSEHGVAWAVELVRLLKPRGRVLDIGCANGFALDLLGSNYELHGIEANKELAVKLQKRGIKILGNDLLDESALSKYSEYFDVITSIAVFEHLSDFKKAVELSLGMLKPDGILVFEVPLMSIVYANETWLNSSLEHVYYPTIGGINELFSKQLKIAVAGRELNIRNYASNYIGLVSKDPSQTKKLSEIVPRIFDFPIDELSAQERKVHLLIHLIHAASPTQERLKFLKELFHERNYTPYLGRVIQLWSSDSVSLASSQSHLKQIQLASAWHEKNSHNWQNAHGEIALQLQQQISERRVREADFEQRVRDLKNENADLNLQLTNTLENSAEIQKYANLLDEQVLHDRKVINELQNSVSWKLTKPLRWGSRFLRRWLGFIHHGVVFSRKLLDRRKIVSAANLLKKGDLQKIGLGIQNLNRQTTQAILAPSQALESFKCVPLEIGQPLVSVVIPCFNYGKFVNDAVSSVLRQTLPDVEIIVVDGGSTDPFTREVVSGISHPNVKVFLRENRELVGSNRNFGIEKARGRYVCCLDADDTLDPTYLEKAVFLMEHYRFDLISTAIKFVGAREGTMDVVERPTLSDMINGNHVLTCALFRKVDWQAVGGYFDVGLGSEHVAEDWDFWLRIAARGARIRNISNEYLFNYRVHSKGSLSSAAGVKSIDDQRSAILERNKELLSANHIENSSALNSRIFKTETLVTPLVDVFGKALNQKKVMLLAIPLALIGGAERLLSGLCKYLAANGWSIVVIKTLEQDPSFGTSIDWFKDSTTHVYDLPRFLSSSEQADFLQYLVESRKPQICLNAGSRLFYESLPNLKKGAHKFSAVDFLFNTIGHVDSHLEFRNCIDFVLAENQEVIRWYTQIAKWPLTQTRLLASGVHTDEITPQPRVPSVVKRLGVSQDTLIIGYSGRLSEEKAPLSFLKIAELCQSIPDLKFVMTGGGPMSDKVEKAANALATSSRFEFVGLVDNVYDFIASYDVLILPSIQDGRPLVVMEALASGVPVIASSVGGLPELIKDGETGFLVSASNLTDFSDRIKRIALDRSLLEKLKRQARQYAVEALDSNKACETFEIALSDAIQYRS